MIDVKDGIVDWIGAAEFLRSVGGVEFARPGAAPEPDDLQMTSPVGGEVTIRRGMVMPFRERQYAIALGMARLDKIESGLLLLATCTFADAQGQARFEPDEMVAFLKWPPWISETRPFVEDAARLGARWGSDALAQATRGMYEAA